MDLRRVLTRRPVQFLAGGLAGLFGATQTSATSLGFDPFERALLERAARAGRAASRPGPGASDRRRRSPGSVVLILLGLGTGIGPHPAARIWLPARPHRHRASPPPRPADPDRRHHSGQARPGGDLATGPIARALRLAGAQAAKPRPGRGGKGDHVVAPLADEHEVARDPRRARLAPRRPRRRSGSRVSRAYVWAFAASPCRCCSSPAAIQFAVLPPLGDRCCAGRSPCCDRDPLARLAAHPLRARRRPAAGPHAAGGGGGR